VAIVTLGCGRNEVDSDQLAGLFHRDGLRVVADAEDADVVLVNTCTFIAPAKQESIDTILAACDLDRARAVVVVGCMAERYPDELAAEIPEADAVVGFDGYARLPQLVDDILAGRPYERVPRSPAAVPAVAASTPTATLPAVGRRRDLPLLVMPTAPDELPPEAAPLPSRPLTTQDELDRMPSSGPRFPIRRFDGRPWAYLKIASGCDRVCTFCAIPSFRGRFRSRPVDEILAEAAWLVEGGARELVLVSENTTSWGKDLRAGGRDLQPELLAELSQLDDLERIRLVYLQPAELQRPLLEAMAQLPKVASYFDLSLQHVSHDVLARMARSGSPARFAALVAAIRELDPQAVFRSNFILGFPGETEDDVRQLEDFLAEQRLDWVGLFAFSPEDGTPSATMPDQVPAGLAEERRARVSELQERLADDRTRSFLGRRLDVTVEEVEVDGGRPALTVGRSYREAPETDGEIQLVSATGEAADLPVGRTVPVEVVDHVGVDLVAVPLVTVSTDGTPTRPRAAAG
jgi:ribosomal protein S12 methylthiotransferase